MNFGDKLKILRKSKKISQKQLSVLVNVANNTVSDWEHNKYYPDVRTIKKLCEIFETTPSYLITDIDIEDKNYNKETITRLLTYYSKLSDQDRDTINQLVESLSQK